MNARSADVRRSWNSLDVELAQAIEQQPAEVVALARRGEELVPGLGIERVILEQPVLGLQVRGLRLRLADWHLGLRLKRLTGGHRGHLPCSCGWPAIRRTAGRRRDAAAPGPG